LPDHAYFITKCLFAPTTDTLVIPACAGIVITSLIWARDAGWWRILGFVIMPDHYHLILVLGEVKTLSDAIAGVSKYTARHINEHMGRRGTLWEEGFYDHMLRDREDFDRVLTYTHWNPVERGLVDVPEAWPYSTANERFAGEIDWEWLGHSAVFPGGGPHWSVDRVPSRYQQEASPDADVPQEGRNRVLENPPTPKRQSTVSGLGREEA
jgi:REP element-mobilizing transposase RayT